MLAGGWLGQNCWALWHACHVCRAFDPGRQDRADKNLLYLLGVLGRQEEEELEFWKTGGQDREQQTHYLVTSCLPFTCHAAFLPGQACSLSLPSLLLFSACYTPPSLPIYTCHLHMHCLHFTPLRLHLPTPPTPTPSLWHTTCLLQNMPHLPACTLFAFCPSILCLFPSMVRFA